LYPLIYRFSYLLPITYYFKKSHISTGLSQEYAIRKINNCRNPTLKECEDETHTPEMGTWESFGTPEISEFDCRGQNTSHWSVLYIIGNLSKCRCRKWACMNHLEIFITSYGKKKGRKSNWQFDSWPLKVGNRPNTNACRWSATHRWKDFDKSYNFSLDLIPIRGMSKEL